MIEQLSKLYFCCAIFSTNFVVNICESVHARNVWRAYIFLLGNGGCIGIYVRMYIMDSCFLLSLLLENKIDKPLKIEWMIESVLSCRITTTTFHKKRRTYRIKGLYFSPFRAHTENNRNWRNVNGCCNWIFYINGYPYINILDTIRE